MHPAMLCGQYDFGRTASAWPADAYGLFRWAQDSCNLVVALRMSRTTKVQLEHHERSR
jgi:hypothetical protein